MNILLFSNIKGPDRYLPLNLLSIATVGKALGHHVQVIDGQVEESYHEMFHHASRNADLIGVSSYTGPSIRAVIDLIQELRDRGASVPVLWGGYHGTLAHAKLIEEGFADIVVKGYGERAFREIVKWREGRGDLSAAPNIVFRAEGGIHSTPRAPQDPMDDLPPIDYSFVDVPRYYTPSRRIVQYVSSYGCPYSCTFCAEPVHSQRRWSGLSEPRVVSDLLRISKEYSPDRISFVDPNFSSNPRRVLAITESLKNEGAPVHINCNMRARDIVMLSRMMDLRDLYKAGFRRVFVGVESGAESQLKALQKSSTAKDHLDAIMLLDEVGIEVQASFIHDLPNESQEEAQATIDLARKLLKVRVPGSSQSHHFFMPYPGTELTTSLEEQRGFDSTRATQADWSNTSTFRGSSLWNGNRARREWVIEEIAKLHDINESVVSLGELERLRNKVEHVEKYMM